MQKKADLVHSTIQVAFQEIPSNKFKVVKIACDAKRKRKESSEAKLAMKNR